MSRLLISTAVLGLAACAPESGTITIAGLFDPGALACAVPTTTSPMLVAGTLDVTTAIPTYFAAVYLQADLSIGGTAAEVVVAGTTLETANRDVPIIDQKVLSYTATPKTVTIKESVLPLFMPFTVGGNKLTIAIPAENLVPSFGANSPSATISNAQPVDTILGVKLEYRGYMSRSGFRVSTGGVTFPIYLYAEARQQACKVARTLAAGECVAPGQDGKESCCDNLTGASGCP
jgi:hypothetical protein